MTTYQAQRKKSDKYLDSFKDILRRNSMNFLQLEISDDAKDTQEATDMVVKIDGGDVALRVREPSCRYRDLTIRSRSTNGGKTEIHKIREGFGDWYLYGWGDGINTVREYILIDLDKLRKFNLLDKPRQERRNFDGTQFVSIPIGELQMSGCLISKQLDHETQELVDKYISNYMR